MFEQNVTRNLKFLKLPHKKEKRKNARYGKIATKAVVSQKINDAEISLSKDVKTYGIVEENVESAENGKKKQKKGKSTRKI